MSENQQPVLLVTGASGQLGRRVVELLLAANAGPIIATTRTPEKLADFVARGVTVREASFEAPETLAQAFAGADRLLLISTDAVDGTDRRARQHVTAVRAAQAAGVKHVIYTSLTNPGPDSPVLLAPDHYATETALSESTLGWTVLRNNVYADMLPQSLAQAVQLGQLFSAAGDGRIGYVTREDCAQAAAAALASDFEGRRVLDITGPAAVSQAELAELASQLSGKPVTYVPLPVPVLVENLVAAGLPPFVAELLTSFDAAAAQGCLDVASGDFEQLTGHRPTPVADFLAANRDVIAGVATL